MSVTEKALELHQKHKGKLQTLVPFPIETKEDLSLAYTPGVADVSRTIYESPEKVYDYTIKGHTVAIVTDGSAVLGLGNIGPEAALPVMEGKAALFKRFAGLDAFPICLATQDTEEIVKAVRMIAPVFGGINLEDISAPRCFEIEERLQDLGIPVMHDDQHGTAVVALAGLINASKVVGKDLSSLRIVIVGAGAAGHAISDLLAEIVGDIICVDSKGVINKDRDDLDEQKKKLLEYTNKANARGTLQDALGGADVLIGVSRAGLLTSEDIQEMGEDPIVFAMANPTPEIMPEEAIKGGAAIVATGRSDMPNQINNSLAFPGIFKGALLSGATRITPDMKIAAAQALAELVSEPTREKIIPGPFDEGVCEVVSNAVSKSWRSTSS